MLFLPSGQACVDLTFSACKGDVGPVGPSGPQGMKGEQGDKGEKVIIVFFIFFGVAHENRVKSCWVFREACFDACRAALVLGFQDSGVQREKTVRG